MSDAEIRERQRRAAVTGDVVLLSWNRGRGAHLVRDHECAEWPDKTGAACGLCGKAIEEPTP